MALGLLAFAVVPFLLDSEVMMAVLIGSWVAIFLGAMTGQFQRASQLIKFLRGGKA